MVGLLASVVGAIAGLGGGVIIKPTLDLLGHYDVATIGVLSGITVFSMACVSLLRAVSVGVKINGRNSFILALGSIIGGIVGQFLFNYLIEFMENRDLVTVIQAGILAMLMAIIFLFVRNQHMIKTYHLQNALFILIAGFGLGTISAFLGIGGGPLNIAILILAFSMNIREAAINSIFIIFFSQISSITIIAATTGFASFDLSMLSYMVIGGILGGFIGSSISQKFTNRQMSKTLNLTLILIFFINIYNMVRYFI